MILRLALMLVITTLAACGGDSVGNDGGYVGGACIDDRECEFRCQRGDDFPEGLCTVPCLIDDDCPGGAFCIDDEGGICMLGCDFPEDCRFGYTCRGRANRGHGGDSLVCSR